MTATADTQRLTRPPIAKAAMLIRKPVADVFEAFIDPAITARLESGARVRWEWEMYGVSAEVCVKDIDRNKRILIEWSGDDATMVEWRFTPRADGTTFVGITQAGFRGDGDAIAQQAIDSTEGFTLVLAGLKALLEHNITLNLVADRHPEGFEQGEG